ncbi:hypothetical protein CHGG_02408 [Chaetomium globosum CBS 148.51]|uniref:Alpha/beta hydrolase fold-3 domain-containing protein n=1 Tax=Chaetomium globosum (strain ATCC 6205 / CBS 148.51 / DSM 1962 / NBRC 6347 / NRRL 1970) TaxID=306901 RepID=Q2HBJ6_CHAGB|nr:uncharacterized protein CHGG_02408 [Chaetomium globosum CBS 148.51]EAQ90473.1 hypothetical protein CHGG_02408 [Chaetomium globosum CBS 148.51]
MTNLTQRKQRNDTNPKADHDKEVVLRREPPPFLTKLMYAGYMYGLKSILGPVLWLRDWQESRAPPMGWPDMIKTYDCRPQLPVRIFLPRAYNKNSQATLPTLFTIHGGGFCIGHQRDDDEWNRAFANTQSVLVISLNYSKAPAHPFPTGLHDLEALLLAVLADASLPIDRTTTSPTSRTAILGFSAGANLALSVSQLPTIHTHPLTPAAALSVYGCLDVSYPPHEKLPNRPWKTSLPPPRNSPTDGLISLAPAFDWSYIPYGQALRDPLLSPHHAARDALPPNVCVVAAELDMLAHESWRFACRLSREGFGAGRGERVVPDRGSAEARWRELGGGEGGDEGCGVEDRGVYGGGREVVEGCGVAGVVGTWGGVVNSETGSGAGEGVYGLAGRARFLHLFSG